MHTITHALALFRCHVAIAVSQHIAAIPVHLAITTIVIADTLLLGG
jgi:hypothetical protein